MISFANAVLDPAGREIVDAHLGRIGTRQTLAETEDPGLHRGKHLRIAAFHAMERKVPGHVEDDPRSGGLHERRNTPATVNRALEIDLDQPLEFFGGL